MPKIEIMLPYYGDVAMMKLAVESVIKQEVTDWKLVVIDDGYPDPEPARWFAELTQADSRITYLRNETNLGANGNYRLALGMVESDYFVMMGADDVMQPNYLSVILKGIEEYGLVDVIQPGVLTIDEHGELSNPLPDRIKRLYEPSRKNASVLRGKKMATSLLKADWAYFPSLAWKTATVKRLGFRMGYDVVQDLALLLDIAAEDGQMLFAPEECFLYRRHLGSDSMVKALDGTRFDEERRFFQWQADRFKQMGWKSAYRAARNRWTSRLNALSLMGRCIVRGKFDSMGRLTRHLFA